MKQVECTRLPSAPQPTPPRGCSAPGPPDLACPAPMPELSISCPHSQALHLLPLCPGSPPPPPMPKMLGKAQGAPKKDTQKPGQPPSCFSAPICAPRLTALPVLASSLGAFGQQKATWSPSIAAGSDTFSGGVRAGPAGRLGGGGPRFSATSWSHHYENGFTTAACTLSLTRPFSSPTRLGTMEGI